MCGRQPWKSTEATFAEKMAAPVIYDHVAVNLKHYVLVFGGISMNPDTKSENVNHFIWSYNFYTDQWRKYQIPESKSTPLAKRAASAVAIGTDVFVFGGLSLSNFVWRLTINKSKHFTLTKMPENAKSETPSERHGHSAWVYMGQMWVFGGKGMCPSQGYLNKHGDVNWDLNNQLLCYNPCNNVWSNPKCFGAVPSPRESHATAIISDKVFLYGGYQHQPGDDFFMMTMGSQFWTQIKTANQHFRCDLPYREHPKPLAAVSLTAVTANHLVLHGGKSSDVYHDTMHEEAWIFDVEHGEWKRYRRFRPSSRFMHTGTRGLTNSVFIIGGCSMNGSLKWRKTPTRPTLPLVLGSKSLQQLAMHTIYQHKDMLPWKRLPSKLIYRLMDPAERQPGKSTEATCAEKMAAPVIYDHVAVNLKHYVLVFGGISMDPDTKSEDVNHFIWSYNFYTDQWRKYQIPESKSTPLAKRAASAVAIGTDVFVFGGLSLSNFVWRLTINKSKHFTLTKMPENAKSETPSERYGHSAWVYMGQMWVFGGKGMCPSQGYLNEHGDVNRDLNNQLLCYNPCNNVWSNPKCFGAVPSPRESHATAIISDKVFLYGGYQHQPGDDFFMMTMGSQFWTEIKIANLHFRSDLPYREHPKPLAAVSLTAVTANHLVLHGGKSSDAYHSFMHEDAWIFDVEHGEWKRYRRFRPSSRFMHTGTRGLTNSVFIIGGCSMNGSLKWRKIPTLPILPLVLGPKSLQQLAMHTIYQHKDMLPWKHLPSKLIYGLMGPAEDAETN